MRLLVLGGTLFLGRTVVEAALRRGWHVTTFNRGQSGADVPGVQALRGDRTNPTDMRHLAESGAWEAVVDMCGYVPQQVLGGARLLQPVCDSCVFVSTVSVYEGWPAEPLSEAARVLDCPADADEDFGPPDVEDGPTRYGRLKAGCERAVLETFGAERTINVRPGVVLGPGEYVGRLPWWLRRIAAGGHVLAPGARDRSIQPVDVRDVANFVLDSLVAGTAGTFNITAPIGRDTFADLLNACKKVTDSNAELVWVPDDLLRAHGVRQWSELPLWRTHRGVWQVDSTAAHSNGLKCRPLLETVAATWEWLSTTDQALINERSTEIGLSRQRESDILASLA
ncbi:NAD-dependent epimerase/dehydratase family protein [Allorhizocola rhizosphaerae]|uniref:NAD-dependent epimerase/dehydratase family protein n=1 Tax=Allorhizocola rhizosphaerae TaxID=1872709 RepID=UPI000E3D2C6F|nr:NAD-dependent epimerase/dehydratase family protein [Allorhizocola rhizosphaerae]